MGKIAVVSDTHDHLENIAKFAEFAVREKVVAVFHCGDIISPFVKNAFMPIKEAGIPFYGVYGNNDGERAGLYKIFGEVCKIRGDVLEIELEGKKIIAFHHFSDDMVRALCLSGEYNIVLKGHTHKPDITRIGSTLLVNPGEACGYLTGRSTCALVDLDTMTGKIIDLV